MSGERVARERKGRRQMRDSVGWSRCIGSCVKGDCVCRDKITTDLNEVINQTRNSLPKDLLSKHTQTSLEAPSTTTEAWIGTSSLVDH